MAQTSVVPTGPIQDGGNPTSSNHLQDQAAAAALYVTKPESKVKSGFEFLDDDHKLSSAGKLLSLANDQVAAAWNAC